MDIIPFVRVQIPFLNIRPIAYPQYINSKFITHLLYNRLYLKLIKKDYIMADKLRLFLLSYIEIMDVNGGTEWMWKPVKGNDYDIEF